MARPVPAGQMGVLVALSSQAMGFYDNIRLDKAFPEYGVAAGTTFQTKNLYAGGSEFTITEDGKLVELLFRYEFDSNDSRSTSQHPSSKRVPMGQRMIDYHGDLLLYGARSGGSSLELVVRFTHGSLEWVRPVNDYPLENRTLLIEQGAR